MKGSGPLSRMITSPTDIAELLSALGEPPFRIRQVHHWLYRRLAASFQEMTDLPKSLRNKLAEQAVLPNTRVLSRLGSADGTTKYSLALDDGSVIESVVMPMNGHFTLCLSSQTGCAMGCRFCVTGALGSGRNLRAHEIFAQFRVLMRDQGLLGKGVNVVFMGMGEPLLNFDEVVTSMALLGETVSLRRITLSTAGIVPKLYELAKLARRPNLAVSLNATTDEQRALLMPAASRWQLQELLEALRAYPLERGRRITVEYVLIKDLNDSMADARRLVALLSGLRVKVNVIPLNPDPVYLPGLWPPPESVVTDFAGHLVAAGYSVTVRRSKGADVAAACGQLRGQLLTKAKG